MKTQRPILMSSMMVDAILKGNKTQTRIKVKTQPTRDHGAVSFGSMVGPEKIKGALFHRKDGLVDFVKSPYGSKGDILYVKETCKILGTNEDGDVFIKFKDGYEHSFYPDLEREDYWNDKVELLMENMGKKGVLIDDPENERYTWKAEDVPWTPSIHMPKDAARIWLEITDIRLERLQNISDSDCLAEGINTWQIEDLNWFTNYGPGKDFMSESEYSYDYGNESHSAAKASFCSLWVSINGKESWKSNPLVWVVEFKQIEKPD